MEPELPDLPNKPTRLVSYCPSEEKFTVEDGHTDEAMRSHGLQCYRMGVEAERERAARIVEGTCPANSQLDLRRCLAAAIRKVHPQDVSRQMAIEQDRAIRGTDTE